MDQPQSAQSQDGARITLTPEMRPSRLDGAAGRDVPEREPGAPATASHPMARWPLLLAAGGLVLGLGALGFSIWTYGEGQREILRLSTELAQLRVSLDLYARNGTGSATDLTDLETRLTALETGARGDSVPMPGTDPTAPLFPPTTSTSAPEDCLPDGMRLLVAAGDSYPICGQSAEVAVSVVDNGYITLADGTSVASGGTTPLAGSACMLSVTSGGDEGLTGYAEIRVSC
ncbi:hypothetical protein [Devosia sp. CAU 1758]